MHKSIVFSGANRYGVRIAVAIFSDLTCRFPVKLAGPTRGRKDDVDNPLTVCCRAEMAVCSSSPLTRI